MIKFKVSCDVCKLIKKDKKVLNKIYATTEYDKGSKITLKALQQDYKNHFSYQSLRNHVKKHQAISAEDLTERHLRGIARKAEKAILKQRIEAGDIWNTVMEKGHEQIQDGTIKLRAPDVMRAAKDKSTHDLQVADRELAMAEMIYHFASGAASGANNNNLNERVHAESNRIIPQEEATIYIDPTQESPRSIDSGENRPSGVYYPPSWNAAAYGTGEVSEGDY